MDEELYPIGELAEKVGVTPRTIRYYAAEGLLPPPETRGRYALYGAEHLHRLRLIARLKDAYLPLSEIRARIEHLTDEQVQQLLAEYGDAPTQPPAASATEYVARVLAAQGTPQPALPAPHAAPLGYRTPGSTADTGQFQARLSGSVAEPQAEAGYSTSSPAPARGTIDRPLVDPPETWQRVRLAPGVELHTREPATPASRERMQQLLAFARELFGDEETG